MAFNWRKFPWTNLHDLNLDWIIQTVKTLEENLADAVSTFREMIDTAISNTLTGSGDLTINKTGDVNITGAHVNLSNTYISAGSEQLTLHNPNSNKSMTANYNSGVLSLSNNQDLAAGVALYPIRTPEIVDGDDSDFAANVGYVKTAVDSKLAKLLTGSGDLTIDKTGDVSISGNSIELSNTTISSQGDQLTLHNSASNTSMTATYNAGMLRLQNNQSETGGVAMYPIVTLPDDTGDNSKYAANVGYVKDAVNPLSEQLAAIEKRAPRVFYFSSTENPGELSADDVPTLKKALVDHTPVILVAHYSTSQYFYYLTSCFEDPTPENINTDSFDIEFRTLDGLYRARITLVGPTGATAVFFETIT